MNNCFLEYSVGTENDIDVYDVSIFDGDDKKEFVNFVFKIKPNKDIKQFYKFIKGKKTSIKNNYKLENINCEYTRRDNIIKFSRDNLTVKFILNDSILDLFKDIYQRAYGIISDSEMEDIYNDEMYTSSY
uniref:Uncharacterized protein n=1 Tax=viral metagenome TaxID=1070528 RepID=A0A6C0AD80_9ZZZZ